MSRPCRCRTKFVSTIRHEHGASLLRWLHGDCSIARNMSFEFSLKKNYSSILYFFAYIFTCYYTILACECDMNVILCSVWEKVDIKLRRKRFFRNLLKRAQNKKVAYLEAWNIHGLDILNLLVVPDCWGRVDPILIPPSTFTINANSNNATTIIIFVERIPTRKYIRKRADYPPAETFGTLRTCCSTLYKCFTGQKSVFLSWSEKGTTNAKGGSLTMVKIFWYNFAVTNNLLCLFL